MNIEHAANTQRQTGDTMPIIMKTIATISACDSGLGLLELAQM
ncbi:MAG: hypothetical protein R3C44_07080 [Chloroflexota bacterium]